MRMQPIVHMILVGCRLPEKSEVVGKGGKPLDDVMVYAICMKKVSRRRRAMDLMAAKKVAWF